MAWNLKGHYYDSCSCKMSCRCALGPAEPDQGWCSGLQLVEVESGQSNGLDLGGSRFALTLQLPGDFFGGVEKARRYFDEARTTAEQRDALGSIYRGDEGGVRANAPVVAAFEVDTMDLVTATGAKWSDPDLRGWESLGNGGLMRFDWKS